VTAPPIAIVCAMEWELAHALRAASGARRDGDYTYVAELDGQQVVLAYCGMGMVSAAAGAQAVISRYAPRAVLNYGCAGAHRLELLPGDIVVGTRVVASDNVRETPEGEVGYAGMHYLSGGEQRHVDALACDADLVAAARCVASEQIFDAWPVALAWPEAVEHRPPRVVFGTVVSADRWNRAPTTLRSLVERHDSLCEDMEAAAIGLVCASHGVPFLTVKDISNNELLRATRSGMAMLEEIGVDQLARRAAAFTLTIARRLPGSGLKV
jgi:adenosylhomocysteine nucleosidase